MFAGLSVENPIFEITLHTLYPQKINGVRSDSLGDHRPIEIKWASKNSLTTSIVRLNEYEMAPSS